MRTSDYSGIVPQDVLDIGYLYLDNDADIECFLIADDLRNHKLREFQKSVLRHFERFRVIDWQKVGSAIVQGTSTFARAVFSTASFLFGKAKQKSEEMDWAKVRTVLGASLKVVAVAVGAIAVAVIALPLLALAAIPFALIAYDPWLIAVDSENRFWVIAEWFD